MEHVLTPTGPYSLRATLGWAPRLSVRHDSGSFRVVFRSAGGAASAHVWQRASGEVVARVEAADEPAALIELRFLLALDDDHQGFLDIASGDDLLARLVAAHRGMRPVRTSVAQSLVHAFAGQLVTGREAWLIERRVSLRLATPHDDLLLPLTCDELRASSPAEFVRAGLAPQRARALAQAARRLDVDGLRDLPVDQAVARLARTPGIGPWSVGIVGLGGLGSYAHGIAGDLGLMRLCGNLLRRTPTVQDTIELLARYGRWAGIASLHLVRHPLAHRRTFAA